MFKHFDFSHHNGMTIAPGVPRHVGYVARYLVGCMEPDGDPPPAETIHAWATYAESLIPLRLPLYRFIDVPELEPFVGGGIVIIGGRAGVAVTGNTFGRFPLRPAVEEEVCPGGLIWDALHETDEHDAFMADPSPPPSSPKNCALAYALMKLDRALGDEATLPFALSVAAVTLGLASEVIGGKAARSESAEAGAAERWSRDPTQAAKEDAEAMWPEAKRKGWTADRMWTALRDKGHSVRADTVRKWLTNLRKTGMC